MAKKQTSELKETTPVASAIGSQAANEKQTPPPQSLAKRLAARTGLGVGFIAARLAAYNDDVYIEALLYENDIPEILQLLEPANKA